MKIKMQFNRLKQALALMPSPDPRPGGGIFCPAAEGHTGVPSAPGGKGPLRKRAPDEGKGLGQKKPAP